MLRCLLLIDIIFCSQALAIDILDCNSVLQNISLPVKTMIQNLCGSKLFNASNIIFIPESYNKTTNKEKIIRAITQGSFLTFDQDKNSILTPLNVFYDLANSGNSFAGFRLLIHKSSLIDLNKLSKSINTIWLQYTKNFSNSLINSDVRLFNNFFNSDYDHAAYYNSISKINPLSLVLGCAAGIISIAIAIIVYNYYRKKNEIRYSRI